MSSETTDFGLQRATMGDMMMQRVRDARPLLDKVRTHRFALDDVSDAFELQETGRCGKILLYPQGIAP